MSRSKRRPKPKRPGDGCFLCDPVQLEEHRRKLAESARRDDVKEDTAMQDADARDWAESPRGLELSAALQRIWVLEQEIQRLASVERAARDIVHPLPTTGPRWVSSSGHIIWNSQFDRLKKAIEDLDTSRA